MSQLMGIRASRRFSRSQPSSITAVGNLTWSLVGPGSEHLLQELENFYWQGVKAELENIMRTLKAWQEPDLSDVAMDDENDDHIYGFDTFIDQVSREARQYANHQRKKRESKSFMPQLQTASNDASPKDYRIKKVEYYRDKIKSEVKKAIDDTPKLKGMQQRAWVLLQNAGFLDLEKLIEHRPLDKLGVWNRPAIPQLAFSKLDKKSMPKFEPLRCARSSCKNVICGSMFTCNSPTESGVVCESCYRLYYYGDESYSKAYKHSILSEAITSDISMQMCGCKLPAKFDECGRPISLFPISRNGSHIIGGQMRCNLLKLRELVALAKYQGLIAAGRAKEPSKFTKIASRLVTGKKKPQKAGSGSPDLPRTKEDVAHAQAQADTDIPRFLRKQAQKYPFGNVHMALRVGPLIIENGVSQSKGGAHITLRELPVFHQRFPSKTQRDQSLAVDGSPDRSLWRRKNKTANQKRYKAVMKQVVGVPFSGVLPYDAELQIVNDVLAESKAPFDNPDLSESDQDAILDSALEPILRQLKTLIQTRVRVYLQSIAQRLLDPVNDITWSITENNCQKFCDSIIDHTLFKYLVNGPGHLTQVDGPLYTMSFVCPNEGYTNQDVKSQFDVPKGLTEEYLLRFRFGRYDEADIIDTYQEYWHDWGAFGGSIYPYQDLFPWDCTEAYRKCRTRCGECNLAKHVWAFPFDSWSIAALHLARDSHMYAPTSVVGETGLHASPQSWLKNRLQVLRAASILHRVAAAMAKSRSFCRATAWLAWLDAEELRNQNVSLIRVKLGGIHRAQPYSHYFEAGKGVEYWIAPWALQPRSEQIRAYEKLRDERMQLATMAPRLGLFATSDQDNSDDGPVVNYSLNAVAFMADAEDIDGTDSGSQDATGPLGYFLNGSHAQGDGDSTQPNSGLNHVPYASGSGSWFSSLLDGHSGGSSTPHPPKQDHSHAHVPYLVG